MGAPLGLAKGEVLTVVRPQLPEWAEPYLRPARYKCLYGGRGSGKSHTFAQLALLRMAGLLPEYDTPVRIASARQFQRSIEESVKQAVEHYIGVLGLDEWFNVTKYAIEHVNGSRMFFPGFSRHPESIRSTEGVDILWIEEAQTLQDEMNVITPTIRKPGSELWFSWNPMRRTDWAWKRFVQNPRDGDLIEKVNYYDNPWFPQTASVADMEDDRENDPEYYRHAWLGEPDDGDAGSVVLPYDIARRCVEAWDKRPKWSDRPFVHGGFDLAYGGRDKCSLTLRSGPVVYHRESWPGVLGDVVPAVERAHELMGRRDAQWKVLYYDATGGDTIRGPFLRLSPDYAVRAVNFGGTVDGADVDYERGRPNKEVFARMNVQMAYAVRGRAMRTVRLLKGQDVDPLTCLFINPEIGRLEEYLAELSRPLKRVNPTSGKLEIDKRGGEEESPDDFDSLCLAYRHDCRKLRAR